MSTRFPLLPDHEVLAKIGTGTLGTVYKALNHRTRELVALKRIPIADPDLAARLIRDFRAAALLDHPGVVRVRELHKRNDAVLLTSDLVDGFDVDTLLTPPAGKDPDRVKLALYLFGLLLKALAYVHAQGIVHRGLKPTNVLVTRDLRLRLTDVGLSREWSTATAEATPEALDRAAAYFAPEQLLGQPVDARTDLFAVGTMLVEVLTGERARPARPGAGTLQGVVDPAVEECFWPCLHRLIAARPDERFAGAVDALRALKPAWEEYAARSMAATAPGLSQPGPMVITSPLGATSPFRLPAPLAADVPPGTTAEHLAAAAPEKVEITQPMATDLTSTAELRISDLNLQAVFSRLDESSGRTAGRHALVGRSLELRRLEEALRDLEHGEGRMVVLSGESGIGKTRLLAELAARARERGAVVLSGGGAEGKAAREPLTRLLEAVARRIEMLAPPEREKLLQQDCLPLAEVSPAFRRLLAHDPPEATDAEEASGRTYRLRSAMTALLGRLAERIRLVCLLDDLSEADEDTIEVLAHVVRSLLAPAKAEDRRPILFAIAHRSDPPSGLALEREVQKLARERVAEAIELDRLLAAEARALSLALFGSQAAPAELHDYIWSQTEGNPLFIVETVNLLREEGTVTVAADGAIAVDRQRLQHATPRPDAGGVPQRLFAVVRRRLDMLSGPARAALEVASLIGRQVDTDLLLLAADTAPAGARDALVELDHARLLIPVEESKGRLEFDHPMTREVTLAEMAPDVRQSRALRAAKALEEVRTPGTDAHARILASLYDQAGLHEPALVHLPAAAAASASTGDLRAALAAWRRTAELAEGKPAHAVLLARAERETARLLAMLGELEQASEAYQRLVQSSRGGANADHLVDALNGLAEARWKGGDYDTAQKAAEEAKKLASARSYPPGEAAALENLGSIRRRSGDPKEASSHFREALRLRRALGDEVGAARLLQSLGIVFRNQDNQDRARLHLEEARAIYQRLGDRLGLAATLANLAGVCARENELPRAAALYLEARGHDEAMGNVRGVALCDQSLGFLDLTEGDYRAALARFQGALEVFERVGDRQNAGFAQMNLGQTYHLTGNHAEAAKRYRAAVALAREIEGRPFESEARAGLALALIALGDRKAAADEATLAVDLARTRNARDKEAWARHALAQVTGSIEQAEKAVALAESAALSNLLFVLQHALARLLLEHGERDKAKERLQKAFTIIESLAERAGAGREAFLRTPAVEAVYRDAKRM